MACRFTGDAAEAAQHLQYPTPVTYTQNQEKALAKLPVRVPIKRCVHILSSQKHGEVQ